MSTRKIFTNTLAQIGAKVMTVLISIYMIKILTGYLDIAGYGMYSKIYNYLSIFSVIADLGLYTITVREISENLGNREKVQKIASNVLTLRTGMGIAIILLAVGVGFFLPGYNSSVALYGICITGFFTLFGLMNSSIMSLLQAHLRTEFSFISTVTGKITTFLTILLFAFVLFPKDSIAGDTALLLVFFAGLLGNFVMTFLTYWYSRRVIPLHFAWDIEYIRHILRISLPYGLALFLNVIFFKVDVILLSMLEAPALADHSIALYSVPMKIVEVGMMYGTVFLNSLLPVLTLAIREGDMPKVTRLTQKSMEMLLFFGIGISSALILFAPEVILMIANTDYATPLTGYSSVDALRVVAPIFLFYFLSSLFTYVLIAEGRQKSMMWINGIIALVNIIGNILVIPYYGFMGSAYITVLSQVLLLIFTWYVTRRHIHLRSVLPFFLVLLVLISIAVGLTYLLLPLISTHIISRLFLGVVIFGVIYAGGAGVWWWTKMRENPHFSQ